MGSIASRPKVPSQQQVVFAPRPVAASPNVAPPPPTQEEAQAASAKEASRQRKGTLLRRSRSLSGTVLTSLRGLLDTTDTANARKTLLGE